MHQKIHMIRTVPALLLLMGSALFISCRKEDTTITNSGKQWLIFDTSNSALTGNNITSLWIDEDNQLWATAIDEKLKLDTVVFMGDTIVLGHSEYNNQIIFISKLEAQNIFDTLNSPFLKNGKISSIAHHNDAVYAGMSIGDGLWVKRGTEWSAFYPPGGTAYYFEDFCFDASGRLWFGAGNGGLYSFDGQSFSQLNELNSYIPYPAYVIDVAYHETVQWVMTSNALLSNQFIALSEGGGAMAIDSKGTVWLARQIVDINNRGELLAFDGVDTTLFQMPVAPSIADMAVDLNDIIWIATDDGLLKFDGTAWTHLDMSNSLLPSNHLTKIRCDEFNNIWIGTSDRGLVAYNPVGILF